MSGPAIELKGSLFTLLVLRLLRPDLEATAAELREKVEQAPGFFADAPVVVDLKSLEGLANAVDFDDLRRIVRDAGLVPVGVRNGTPKQQQAALAAGFGVIPEGRMAPEREERPQCAGKVVSQQVRSGQQLFSPRGELVVVGAVSNGAEVLAEGSIHIYGPLRGRALAGVRGNEEARIFCRALEAELVSIAGTYLLAEDIADEFRGKPAQIYLRDERLIIEGL